MPVSFFFRRIHSLFGLGMVLFLFEHFITNSQAAYFLDQGNYFVKSVNFLQSIPYLHAIEICLIGIPFCMHAFWGLNYIITSESNTKNTDDTMPVLEYSRNRAYSLQRVTSYILLILIIFHVLQVRVIRYPIKYFEGSNKFFLVKVQDDEKLKRVLKNMNATLFFNSNVNNEKLSKIIENFKLENNEVVAMTNQSGKAMLLTVRDLLKNPIMVGVYTIFVLSASFHAINGLWTFLITWGFIITNRSQKISLHVCFWILIFVLSLGLISVWSSFLY